MINKKIKLNLGIILLGTIMLIGSACSRATNTSTTKADSSANATSSAKTQTDSTVAPSAGTKIAPSATSSVKSQTNATVTPSAEVKNTTTKKATEKPSTTEKISDSESKSIFDNTKFPIIYKTGGHIPSGIRIESVNKEKETIKFRMYALDEPDDLGEAIEAKATADYGDVFIAPIKEGKDPEDGKNTTILTHITFNKDNSELKTERIELKSGKYLHEPEYDTYTRE